MHQLDLWDSGRSALTPDTTTGHSGRVNELDRYYWPQVTACFLPELQLQAESLAPPAAFPLPAPRAPACQGPPCAGGRGAPMVHQGPSCLDPRGPTPAGPPSARPAAAAGASCPAAPPSETPGSGAATTRRYKEQSPVFGFIKMTRSRIQKLQDFIQFEGVEIIFSWNKIN